MQNLHLKNLNNTDHVENYLIQLEKYEKAIEDLSTEKLTLFSEITENKEDQTNLINNISQIEEQIKQLKQKQKTLTSVLLNYFLNELEKLNKLNNRCYKNIEIIRSWINDFKNNRERYVEIKELRYMNNNIKNMKE